MELLLPSDGVGIHHLQALELEGREPFLCRSTVALQFPFSDSLYSLTNINFEKHFKAPIFILIANLIGKTYSKRIYILLT